MNAALLAELRRKVKDHLAADHHFLVGLLTEIENTPSSTSPTKLHFTPEWLRKKIADDPDVDVEAGPAIDLPRFFMEHGMIHDRVTGQHVHTLAEIEPGATERLFALLIELSSTPSATQAKDIVTGADGDGW